MNISIHALGSAIDKSGENDDSFNLFLVEITDPDYTQYRSNRYVISKKEEIDRDDAGKIKVTQKQFPTPRTEPVRHIKSGGLYQILGLAYNIDLKKGPNAYVLYVSLKDRVLYVRTQENFAGKGVPGQDRFEYL